MPGSSELVNRLLSAHGTNNVHDAKDAYSSYCACHCYNPQRMFLYDAHLGKRVWRDVPCGVCYHCRQTKMNSWVTRMYAHCEHFKHVYFVTLTFRGFSKFGQVPQIIMNRFADACWHFDSFNQNHRAAWHPCLLVKKHYQDFLKRLRKNTGYDDISYVVSGEYGKKYGRPHYHLILFSNHEITQMQVEKAWSVDLFRDSMHQYSQYRGQKLDANNIRVQYLIGRVDFNDLVTNGTFNTTEKVRIDGTDYAGAKCFAYVCKYVCKNNDFNKNRVLLAYNSLYVKRTFVRLYNHDVPIEDVETFLNDLHVVYNDANIRFIKTKLSYEKIISKVVQGFDDLYRQNLSKQRCISSFGCKLQVEYFPSVLVDFTQLFRPFVEFSRGTAIGSLYAKAHIHEFVDGVYNKPNLQIKGFVVPSYFARKANEYIYGLRKMSASLSSKSGVLANIPLIRDYFAKVYSGEIPFGYSYTPDEDKSVHEMLYNPSKCWLEKSFGSTLRYVFPVTEEGVMATSYKYDKHERRYYLYDIVPISEFLSRQLFNIDKILHRHEKEISDARHRLDDLEHAKHLLVEFNLDESDLRADFVARQTAYLHDKQCDYDMLHQSVE